MHQSRIEAVWLITDLLDTFSSYVLAKGNYTDLNCTVMLRGHPESYLFPRELRDDLMTQV